MSLLKRIFAAAAACVLSVCLLTACGGTTTGLATTLPTKYEDSKSYAILNQWKGCLSGGGTITYDAYAYSESDLLEIGYNKIVTNGTLQYIEFDLTYDGVTGRGKLWLNNKTGETYMESLGYYASLGMYGWSGKMVVKYDTLLSEEYEGYVIDIENIDDDPNCKFTAAKPATEGNYAYSETVTYTNGTILTCCYDESGALQCMVVKESGSDEKTVIKNLNITTSYDATLLGGDDLYFENEGYVVLTYDEFMTLVEGLSGVTSY